VDQAKHVAHSWIDARRDELSRWHSTIWDLAEPAWRERESARWYVETLRRCGFEVEEGSAGMPTAFCARWRNPDSAGGPTLLTYAEYDAVPGNCQAATTRREPRAGLSELAPGHTDPHSALGMATLAGVLSTQQAMAECGIPGELVYMGEPAEKVQGSKVVHGLRGYYDGVDAIVSFHPFYLLPLCNTARWDTHCGAYYSRVYTFVCDAPETWGGVAADSPIPAAHSAARAPGANAALFTLYSLTRTTADAMLPATGGWSLNEAVLAAGQATADNQPARLSRIQYSWRCPDVASAEAVLAVLDRNAALAAESAHCRLDARWVSRNRPGLPNHELATVVWENLKQVGAPHWGEDARKIARELQRAIGVRPLEDPFLRQTCELIAPWEAEHLLRRHLPPEQRNWTSDDYVEMTWYAPTARFYVARPTLAPVEELGAGYPAWVMNALGGIPETIDPTILVAGKVVAGTLLDLFRAPGSLQRAKAEHARRVVDHGELAPLLPADFTLGAFRRVFGLATTEEAIAGSGEGLAFIYFVRFRSGRWKTMSLG
jgi:aminobenzoyl-glutamate utilization protein B